MPETYKRRYGLDWPPEVHDIQIELTLAKKWRFAPFKYGNLLDPGEHLVRAIKALFTPAQWTVSPWTEEHAHAWAFEDFSIWLGAASTGKAQPLDEPVMTPTGPRKMGDLRVGDLVIGLNGAPVRVKSTHDAGVREEYLVVSKDGCETRCAYDHLWNVINRDISKVVTISTKDLNPRKHLLPNHGKAMFDAQPVPLDAYLLGALLGDGCMGEASGRGSLLFSNKDASILDRVRSGLPEGHELVLKRGYDWRIVKKQRLHGGSNLVTEGLRALNLWGSVSHNKFIPAQYLYNSVAIRRGVLAGLLDTDGTIDKRGLVSFTSSSVQLATDIMNLVRSLGGRASVRKKQAGYRHSGVYVACRPAYQVYISFADMYEQALFPACPRKRGRLAGRACLKRVGLRSVTATGRAVPMKCITVEAEDGIYLTGSLMPTHNSNDAGGMAVLDWITDPLDTYIALASTSVPMLKLRSFESVTRYFRALKKNEFFLIPGKESASQTAIINDNDSEDADATSKASIRGVALADGDEAKAVARLAGAHLPWVTIILDEGSALPSAAAKARFNAAAGARRFRFLSLANPVSQHDEATKFCAPLNGWLTVTPETPSWRSQYGLVLHHNGFQSPAVLEECGAEKYPFLINKMQIDRMLKEVGGNEDDPMIWSMVKGFPAPQGTEATVLSPVDLNMFHASDKAVWGEDVSFVEVAGVDPAFVAEGDGCIMQRARVGITREGVHTISFYPEDRIPIGVSAPRPGAYQAADGVMRLALEHGLAMGNIAVDDSGTQSVCDILEVESGRKPIRCNFAAKATPPGENEKDADGNPAKPKYRNMVTEMWHFVAKLVRENQIRDLPVPAAAQLCSRRYRRDVKPLTLESKKDYKKRQAGQKSPDEADALAMCCYAAMKVAGLQAGKQYSGSRGSPGAFPAAGMPRQLSVDYTRSEGDSRFANYARV